MKAEDIFETIEKAVQIEESNGQLDKLKQQLITLISGGGQEQERAAEYMASEIVVLRSSVATLIKAFSEL